MFHLFKVGFYFEERERYEMYLYICPNIMITVQPSKEMQTEKGLDSPPEQHVHTSKTCPVLEFFSTLPLHCCLELLFFK